MKTVLSLEQVSKQYRGKIRKALDCLSLEINSGTVYGFLGPNGAGKTTTIKLLLGFLRPSSGTISIHGKSPLLSQTRSLIGYLPETANYYWFMSPEKILRFYGACSDFSGKALEKRIDYLLDLVSLKDVRKDMIKTFSKGMTQRVGIAQALLSDPALLILDEPASGLDPIGRKQVREVIKDCANEGKTIFFSSHELGEVESVCSHIGIVSHGACLFDGTLDKLRAKTKRKISIFCKKDGFVLNKLTSQFASKILDCEMITDGSFSITLKQPSQIYSVMRFLESCSAEILSVSDMHGDIEEVFFEVIQQQERSL